MANDMSNDEKREVRRWKALEVRTNPMEVYWGGVRQEGFFDTDARFLFIISATGRASHNQLVFAFDRGTDPGLASVYASKLRKKFQHRNIDVDIVNIRGWGYELRLIGDAAEQDKMLSYDMIHRFVRLLISERGGAVSASAGVLNAADGNLLVRQDGEMFTVVLDGSTLRLREDQRSA